MSLGIAITTIAAAVGLLWMVLPTAARFLRGGPMAQLRDARLIVLFVLALALPFVPWNVDVARVIGLAGAGIAAIVLRIEQAVAWERFPTEEQQKVNRFLRAHPEWNWAIAGLMAFVMLPVLIGLVVVAATRGWGR